VRARYSTGTSVFTDPWNYYWDSTGVYDPSNYSLPESFRLDAYPNPTNGELSISLTGRFPGDLVNFGLYDLLGREIVQSRLSALTKERTIQIALPASLPGGIYVLTAANDYLLLSRKIVYLP
jgi:hypothetical protein